MELTDKERNWALKLKQEVSKVTSKHPLTDYEIAQFAIVTAADNTNRTSPVVKRMVAYQKWKQQHNIPEVITPQDIKQDLIDLEALFPGFFAVCDSNNTKNLPMFGTDFSKAFPAKLKNKEESFPMFRSQFYLFGAMTNNFDNIRKGGLFVLENEGRGWANFSIDLERRSAELHQHAFPIIINDVYLLNVSGLIKGMIPLTKPLLSQKLRKSLHVYTTKQYEEEFGDSDPVKRGARERGEKPFDDFLQGVLDSYSERLRHMEEFKFVTS